MDGIVQIMMVLNTLVMLGVVNFNEAKS